MITTVFFDWGGVLASGGHSFWKTVQDRMGVTINESDIEDFKLLRVGLNSGKIPEEEFSKGLEKITGVNVPGSIWEMSDVVNILPEMRQFALSLKDNGYKIGVISNMSKVMVSNINGSGGYDPFSVVINSCEVGFMKPGREIYDIALDRAGEHPEKCLFIDDLEANLVYPASLGMKTVLGVNSKQIIEDVSKILG